MLGSNLFRMLTAVHPKLPMRNPAATQQYYVQQLGFALLSDYGDYLILEKDQVEIHFFLHKTLVPEENDGQVYIRVQPIEALYTAWQAAGVHIHTALAVKPWGQWEFSLLDPDHNLLTFGQAV